MNTGKLLVVLLNDPLQDLGDLAIIFLAKVWCDHLLEEACEHERVHAQVLSSLQLRGRDA